MEIKRLTVEHYDALLALLNDTFGNKAGKPVDFLSVQPKMWVRDDEHMRCHFGVFEDGRLCAVVGIYPLRTVIDGTPFLFATTGNVATHPEYRRRGLGRTIMETVIGYAREKGITFITLEVRESNAAAIGLYETFGFYQVGRLKNYYDSPKEDGLILKCDL